MAAFFAFMNGTVGRWLRVLLGIALIVYGLLVFAGTTGVVIAAIGLVPIVMGLWGHCLVGPFVHRAKVTY